MNPLNTLIAASRTRKRAIEALRRSAQNNPYSVITGYSNGQTLSITEWHQYSYDLISSIEQLR